MSIPGSSPVKQKSTIHGQKGNDKLEESSTNIDDLVRLNKLDAKVKQG